MTQHVNCKIWIILCKLCSCKASPPPRTEGLSHYRTFETTLHIWSGIVDADVAAIIAPCIQHKQQFWLWIADILKIPVFIRVLFQQKICFMSFSLFWDCLSKSICWYMEHCWVALIYLDCLNYELPVADFNFRK